MSEWRNEILQRISHLSLGPEREAQIVEELSQHLEDRFRELSFGGTPAEEARQCAIRELGSHEVLAGELKRALSAQRCENIAPGKPARTFLSSLWEDIRYAIRQHRQNPGMTAVTLLMLAIGIGANTTVFSIVNGVLLRPLPFKNSDRLVVIDIKDKPGARGMLHQYDDDHIRELTRSYEAVCGYAGRTLFSKTDEPSVYVVDASADCFRAFDIQPQIGRAFTAADSKPDASPVAVISAQYWRDRFAADPNIIGKTLSVPDSVPLTIVGVFPETFRSPNSPHEADAVWASANFRRDDLDHYGGRIYALLKTGVPLSQAQAEVSALGGALLPPATDSGNELEVRSLLDTMVAGSRTTIVIFAGTVLSVLLIVSVNLIGLELARLPKLEGDLAIRSALGASRWRLAQSMLVKTSSIGIAGGACGFALAAALEPWILTHMAGISRKDDIRIDATVFAVSFALTLATSLFIALIPALRASSINLRDIVHASAASLTPDRKTRIFQDCLTAAETALALLLLVAAGLFINNLWRLLSHDLGFNPHGVSTVRVSLPTSYEVPRQQVFFIDLLNRVKSMSSVQGAALSLFAPIEGGSYTSVNAVNGAEIGDRIPINTNAVSPEYFSTFGIPIVAGRTFTDEEMRGAKPVALISASLAMKLWPGENPLGREFKKVNDTLTVVGVVRDVQYGFYANANMWTAGMRQEVASMRTEGSTAYYPITQALTAPFSIFPRSAVVLAKTSSSMKDLTSVISDMEPKAKLTPGAIDQQIVNWTKQQRFQTALLTAFSAVAVLLSAIGLYSVVAHSVGRRTREIGIRMALGAKRREVFADVCRQGIVPSALGILIGLAASLAVQKVLGSYLYAIQPNDGPTYMVVTIAMSVVVLLASAVPASRAARLDPVVALRCE